jgi:capsular polysaccharide export protein
MTGHADPAGLRRVLFLQGPISPFFARLGAALMARGHAVHRINLCLGDRLIWPHRATDFRGRPDAWPAFIDGFLDRHAITDLVLLGEQRAYHQVAIAAAATRGIRVCVTDYGYFRPDWITLERDALGGGSRFPRDPSAIRRLAEGLPDADLTPRFADDFGRQARWEVVYQLASLVPWPFPHYRRFLLHHPIPSLLGNGWRLLRQGAEWRAGGALLEALRGNSFWLFGMQMETDFSIRAYSTWPDMEAPIATALASFARAAPVQDHLLIKVHPLDPGLKRWDRRVERMASVAGLAGRVHVAWAGPLDRMMQEARGVLTVNSTLGLRAVELGVPIKAMGQAVWDVAGLAHRGTLDAWWHEATAPEPALRRAFLAGLQATTQARGAFFAEQGLTLAVAAAVEKLETGRLGVPDAYAEIRP